GGPSAVGVLVGLPGVVVHAPIVGPGFQGQTGFAKPATNRGHRAVRKCARISDAARPSSAVSERGACGIACVANPDPSSDIGRRSSVGEITLPGAGVDERAATAVVSGAGPGSGAAVDHRSRVGQQITVPDVKVRDVTGTGIVDIRIEGAVVGHYA